MKNVFRLLKSRSSSGLLVLALPIMMQGVLSTMMGFVDNLMVGQLGENVISALANSMQLITFIFILFAALSIGGGILMSQFTGADNKSGLEKTISTLLFSGILIGVSVASIVYFSGGWLVSVLTLDLWKDIPSGVPAIAREYLKILSFSLPLVLIGQFCGTALNSTGDTRTPVKVAVFFNAVNLVGNWLLIFGGAIPGLSEPLFQPMGYKGAAVSTLLAGGLQGLVLFFIVFNRTTDWHFNFPKVFSPDFNMLRKILLLGYPMSIDGFYWQGARLFYTIIINAVSPAAFAGYVIVRTFKMLFMLPLGGLGAAISIRSGQLLGASRFRQALLNAKSGILSGVLLMIVPAITLILLSEPLSNLYRVSSQTKTDIVSCCYILAASLFFTAVNATIPAVLRAGGDTTAVMHITLGCFLFIGAPAIYIFAIVFNGGLVGGFLAISLEEIVKSIVFWRRFRSNHWQNKLV